LIHKRHVTICRHVAIFVGALTSESPIPVTEMNARGMKIVGGVLERR